MTKCNSFINEMKNIFIISYKIFHSFSFKTFENNTNLIPYLKIYSSIFLPKFSNWRVRMHSTHQFIYISHLNLSNNNLYLSTLHGIKKVRYCPISIMRSRCVIKYSLKIVFGRMKESWNERLVLLSFYIHRNVGY